MNDFKKVMSAKQLDIRSQLDEIRKAQTAQKWSSAMGNRTSHLAAIVTAW